MNAQPSSPTPQLRDLPAFSQQPWQMSYGERATIEGMLSMLRPALAFEIGRAEGGSLRRIAAHADEVMSFDLVEALGEVSALANVQAFSGDSHAMLPVALQRVAEEGRNIDFVLVDGDHTTGGVRQDMHDLLESDALQRSVILAHDTLNEEVRRGLEEIDYGSYAKVAWVDLDFVPGYVARLPERLGECWGGLGLVVVDSSGAFGSGGPIRSDQLFEQHKLVWPAADWVRRAGPAAAVRLDEIPLVAEPAGASLTTQQPSEARVAALAAELDRHQEWLRGIEGSLSWRLTAPLRTLKSRLRERLR